MVQVDLFSWTNEDDEKLTKCVRAGDEVTRTVAGARHDGKQKHCLRYIMEGASGIAGHNVMFTPQRMGGRNDQKRLP